METRCKLGDMAIVLKSITGKSDGKIVTVVGYIGYFNAEEHFVYNNIHCQVPITDHYWWIECPTGFETAYGLTKRAYGPDKWLQPIRPDALDDTEETGDEVYNIIPADTVS